LFSLLSSFHCSFKAFFSKKKSHILNYCIYFTFLNQQNLTFSPKLFWAKDILRPEFPKESIFYDSLPSKSLFLHLHSTPFQFEHWSLPGWQSIRCQSTTSSWLLLNKQSLTNCYNCVTKRFRMAIERGHGNKKVITSRSNQKNSWKHILSDISFYLKLIKCDVM